MTQRQIKLVAVGDPTVGKSSIFISFTSSGFIKDYIPTTFDNFNKNLITDQGIVSLNLWDTAGQDELAHLRQLSYGQADIFMLVFSTVLISSFENIYTKWLPELKSFSPNTPIILVGSKVDLREVQQRDTISSAKGRELAKHIGALAYCECSALTQEGLDKVFLETVRVLQDQDQRKPNSSNRTKKEKGCVVM